MPARSLGIRGPVADLREKPSTQAPAETHEFELTGLGFKGNRHWFSKSGKESVLRQPAFWPLNWNADPRPTTRNPDTLARAVMISSVILSEKNSWVASLDTLAKGSTAMDTPFAG